MRRISAVIVLLGLVFASTGAGVHAQDKAAYEERSIARLTDLFEWLDMNEDRAVSLEEAQGNIEFSALFDDIDINREGVVTNAELDRFLMQQFGRAAPE
jgi:hypothetical protein